MVVRVRHLIEAPEHPDAGIVHPGVKAAEGANSGLGNISKIVDFGDIGDDVDRPTTVGLNPLYGVAQCSLVARRKHDASAAVCGPVGGRKPYATGGTGHHHDLIGNVL